MGAKTEENDQEQEQEQDQSQVLKLDLNKLEFKYPLGRGAKGVVFRVRVKGCDEDLALKLVIKSSIKNRGEKQSNVFGKNRVSFEEEVLRELNHPFLPRLRGVVETEKVVGYAIDYCPGFDLNSLRKQQVEKMFSDDIIRFYGAELVLALEYLHNKGLVYRDLKPENVLIQENGHLMLVDFDLSTKLPPKQTKPHSKSLNNQPNHELIRKPDPNPKKKKPHLKKLYPFCKQGISPIQTPRPESTNSDTSLSESDSTVGKSNSFVGTEEYVAPEIIQSTGHDFSVDIWCLGVVLYEMLYGTTPFRGANKKETFYRILTKSPDLVGEATPLRDLIRRLLKKDPKERISLEEIKGHDFFKGVDWDMIGQISRPPFIPVRTEIEDEMDGVNANGVESIVYEILGKNDDKNNDIIKNNDGNYDNCGKLSGLSQHRKMRGLNQLSMSGNFSDF